MFLSRSLCVALIAWILPHGAGVLAAEATASASSPVQRTIEFTLRGDATYSWWTLGDVVRFHVLTSTVPDWLESLTGKVVDSLGTPVAESTVARATLVHEGWSWKPTQPGFYEVTFTYREKGGSESKALVEPWVVKSLNDRSRTRLLYREKFTIAVAPAGARPAAERPPQFGFHCEKATDDVIAANLIGFSFVRFWFLWGGNGWEWADKTSAQLLLEPERGKFQWEKYDEYMELFRKNGFAVQAVIQNTPKWASTHPEKTQMDICVPGYAAYPPKDMNDWINAVRAIVTRYKGQVRQWELWNEPHLPGFSVFWRDTPEKFVELLKSGYETVKSVQPDSEVIIGGMTSRYLPFYRELLRLGGGPYFDWLGIHGRMQTPDGFYALDQKFGVKPKPWLNTECHSILVDSLGTTGLVPTESELALRMLQDHLMQIKYGALQTTFFCLINNTNRFEMEAIPYSREERYNIQPSGLFRRYPQIEPRLVAVVMRTFLDRVQGKLAYRGEFEFPSGQKAAWMETNGKSLVLVWNATDKAMPIDPLLLKSIGPDTRVMDWEGRSLSASLSILPGRAYWLVEAKAESLKTITVSDNVLISKEERERRQKKEHTGPRGLYQTQPLFDTPQGPLLNEAKINWIAGPWKFVSANGATSPQDYTARFAVACQASGLDLVVDVSGDDTPHQEGKRGEYWAGDSLQFAIDTEERGMPAGLMEFAAALTKEGAVLWKNIAPSLAGDLPARWTPGNQAVQFGSAVVEKMDGGRWRYKVRIEWNELYPLVWKTGKPLYFSLLVNDNDGAGRLGWIEWSGGIGSSKDPSLYGTLTPAPNP